jgi:SAM-dependent methyltransferase
MTTTMTVPLCCPVHRDALVVNGDKLVGSVHGRQYPIFDDIPVLLADPSQQSDAAAFYNDPKLLETYLTEDQPFDRPALHEWLSRITIDGPVLEIGAGRGALQGIGEPYVALDYSLAALRRWIDPKFQRVCASAEQLPFFDNTFRLVFSVACLEHVPNATAAFDEIHRVLKPGGIAHLAPAWHCVQYNCDGVPVLPYRDLSLRNKWVKATLPVRQNKLFKGIASVPRRMIRRARWALSGKPPISFRYKRLRADYTHFWLSDSDACTRLDSHEACLFFKSRGYDIIRPGNGALRQLTVGNGAVVVQKPA